MRSRYEIIPGGLASRKFITINRTRSDEHLAPQPVPGVLRARNSALRILQGRVFLRRALPGPVYPPDERDDGIISSSIARDEGRKSSHDEIFLPVGDSSR